MSTSARTTCRSPRRAQLRPARRPVDARAGTSSTAPRPTTPASGPCTRRRRRQGRPPLGLELRPPRGRARARAVVRDRRHRRDERRRRRRRRRRADRRRPGDRRRARSRAGRRRAPREPALSDPLPCGRPFGGRSPVAQLAEHPAVNRRVVGSSPTRGVKKAPQTRGFFSSGSLNVRSRPAGWRCDVL